MTSRDIAIRSYLQRVTLAGQIIEDISDILTDARVNLNIDRDIYLQCSISVRDVDAIAPLTDVLALSVEYTIDGVSTTYPLGLYTVVTPPAISVGHVTTAEYQGADLTGLLATSAYTATHNVASGTNVVTEITNTITGVGLTRYTLPVSSRTFRKNWTFPAGTTRLEKINRVLDHIAWTRLAMTRDGRITTPGPYIDPARQEPFATWTDDELLGPVEYTPTDAPIANVVVVIRDDPADEPIVAVARNDDPASRTSTVSVGREIVRVERTSDIHSQADADELAKRLLRESRERYETVRLMVYPDPRALDAFQTARLQFTARELRRYNGIWRIRSAELGVTPASAPLQVELSRIVFDGGTLP